MQTLTAKFRTMQYAVFFKFSRKSRHWKIYFKDNFNYETKKKTTFFFVIKAPYGTSLM